MAQSIVSMIRIVGAGTEGRTDNHFAQPRGICLNPQTKELFVCDCNNHRVLVFSMPSLAFKRQIGRGVQGSSHGCLNYAVGICLDLKRRHLYVADTNNHRICIFNQENGAHVGVIGTRGTGDGQLNSPYGVVIDGAKDCLFVADYDNHRVQVFDLKTRSYQRTIGSGPGTAPGQFNQPIMPCIDEDTGYLYIADYLNNRVQVFDKDTGKFIRMIGGAGLGADALNGPRSVCIDSTADLLFIADREVNICLFSFL
jgi:DNA-binding beta-propeller fold protein YncE